MNRDAPVTRFEFDRALRELHAEIRAIRSAPPVVAATGPAASPEEFVRRGEFRLFKWFTGLALAAILGSLGVLYQAVSDVQRGLVEVHQSLVEVHQGLAGVHQGLAGVHQALGEMHQALAGVHQALGEVHQSLAAVERSLGDVRERLVRVETVLEPGGRAGPGDARPGAD